MKNYKTATNSSYPKGGVFMFTDSFLVNGSLVFQSEFYGKTPALRVAANRYLQPSRSEQTAQLAWNRQPLTTLLILTFTTKN